MMLEILVSNMAVATVLAAVAAFAGRVCPRPALAHGLWLLVLLKLLTPPLAPISLEGTLLPRQTEKAQHLVPGTHLLPMSGTAPLAVKNTPKASFSDREKAWPLSARAQDLLFWLWLGSALLYLMLATWRMLGFQRILKNVDNGGNQLSQEVQQLAGEMGLKKCPDVRMVNARISPVVWGIGRRTQIILPRVLWERLDLQGRRTLLVHELAHLKRRDHRVRQLELIGTAFLWWCPLLWWTRRKLEETSELCCDAWVLRQFPGVERAYATSLVTALEFLSAERYSKPAAACGLGVKQSLKRRLKMIFKGTRGHRLSGWGRFGLLALGLVFLPLGGTLARTPSETPSPEPPKASSPEVGKSSQLQEKAQAGEGSEIHEPHHSEDNSQAGKHIEVEAEQEIHEEVREPLEEVNVQERVREAIEEAAIDKVVQDALRQVEKVLHEIKVHEVVQEALHEARIEQTVVQALEEADRALEQALEEAQIDKVIEEALQDAQIDRVIEEALEQAEIEKKVEESLRQVEESLEALEETEKKTEPD